MESEIETTNFDEKGWVEKIKNWSYENWQTILVILIVLIVGISAYNYNQQGSSSNENQGTVAMVDNDEVENNEELEVNGESNTSQEEDREENNEEVTEINIENEDQAKAAEEDNEVEENENQKENSAVISSSNDSGKVYTVYANSGEGITHLARRALDKYLQEAEGSFELTSEHKIYIEDYLQNRTGTQIIEVDHQETFSESLIEEALSNAEQLTLGSLNNLKKYIK